MGDEPRPQLGATFRCWVSAVGTLDLCISGRRVKASDAAQCESSVVELQRREWSVLFCLIRKWSFVRGDVC